MVDPQDQAGLTEPLEAADAPSAAPSGGPSPAEDWRAAITDREQRRFAERFASPAEVVRAAYEFRQKLSNAVTLPGKGASDEDRAQFRKRLGVPDTPEGYAVQRPVSLPPELAPDAGTGARQAAFLEAMHAAGATPAVVQAAVDWYYRDVAEQLAAHRQAHGAATKEAVAALQKDWPGEAFSRNAEMARRAVAAYGDDSFKSWLETAQVGGMPLGNHPQFLRLFAKIGAAMAEARPAEGGDTGAGGDARERFDALTRDIHDASERGDQAAVERLSSERATLADRLFGGGPIVGTDGRQA